MITGGLHINCRCSRAPLRKSMKRHQNRPHRGTIANLSRTRSVRRPLPTLATPEKAAAKQRSIHACKAFTGNEHCTRFYEGPSRLASSGKNFAFEQASGFSLTNSVFIYLAIGIWCLSRFAVVSLRFRRMPGENMQEYSDYETWLNRIAMKIQGKTFPYKGEVLRFYVALHSWNFH